MSYEAWGDDDDGLDGVRDHYRKHLIEDGWLDEEQAAVLQLRIQDLERELAAMTARAEAAERDAERLRIGLRFYARGHHWECNGAAAGQWDTVSGEPQNWYYRENDTDDAEGIEDGTIAKRVLLGQEIDWDGEEPLPLDEEYVAIDAAREGK